MSRPGPHSQFLSIFLLLLFGQPVFGLGDLEPTLSVEGDEADPQVGTTEIDSEELSRLFALGVSKDKGRDCVVRWPCGVGGGGDRVTSVGTSTWSNRNRGRLTHRDDLSLLLQPLVQRLLKGVHDHPHPLRGD